MIYYSELYHHGIKGQKWGVRRYQNLDGTYTEEGKLRYGIASAARNTYKVARDSYKVARNSYRKNYKRNFDSYINDKKASSKKFDDRFSKQMEKRPEGFMSMISNNKEYQIQAFESRKTYVDAKEAWLKNRNSETSEEYRIASRNYTASLRAAGLSAVNKITRKELTFKRKAQMAAVLDIIKSLRVDMSALPAK